MQHLAGAWKPPLSLPQTWHLAEGHRSREIDLPGALLEMLRSSTLVGGRATPAHLRSVHNLVAGEIPLQKACRFLWRSKFGKSRLLQPKSVSVQRSVAKWQARLALLGVKREPGTHFRMLCNQACPPIRQNELEGGAVLEDHDFHLLKPPGRKKKNMFPVVIDAFQNQGCSLKGPPMRKSGERVSMMLTPDR